MTVSELARRLGVAFHGEDREIIGAAPLDSASTHHLTFVAEPKAFAAAGESSAACLIAPPGYAPAPGRTVIYHETPRGLFARALTILYPPPPFKPGIHPTAVVDPEAVVDGVEIGPHVSIAAGSRIGAGTRIGAGSRIGREVVIGSESLLHAGVTIYDSVRIGARAVLHSGCVIGSDGFGFALLGDRYEKFPQVGIVEIGDDVEIGANTCIDRAALGVTRIGDGTKLDNLVHVGHNCQIGKHVVIAAQTGFSGGVVVGDYAVIGGQVGIGDKVRIETRAVLGSGCGVLTSKVIRAGQVVWGTPARPLRDHLEQLAEVSRLPALRVDFKSLEQRVGKLEKAEC